MIDTGRLEAFFATECTAAELAETMHCVMKDYILMAGHAGCDADLNVVAMHIEFLESVRKVMTESFIKEE